MTAAGRVRLALVGVHGYGDVHLENIRRLVEAGRVDFVAAADSVPPAPDSYAATTDVYSSLDELITAAGPVDVVVLATPIHTHAALARQALAAGAHVYVEKPPLTSLAEYDDLAAAAADHGRSVQVGFQASGSHAVTAAAEHMAAGELGEILAISATGLWTRPGSYFTRSRWAGRRVLDGNDVVDGAVTNPFAHAVQAALTLAGATSADDVGTVTTDLYRANDIDSDDTSVVRIGSGGPDITCAFTLCAETSEDPYVTVYGSIANAVLHYTRDELTIRPGGKTGDAASAVTREYGRDDLLENLIDHALHDAELISPLAATGAFMRVVEAIRLAPDPAPIPDEAIRFLDDTNWSGTGRDTRAVVDDIDALVCRACAAGATFAEIGPKWADQLVDSIDLPGSAAGDGAAAMTRRSGKTLPLRLSPRPYLHPVTSRSGVVVTDAMPTDHPWHLGAGVAVQDVDGINFWGGRTYRPGTGYVWRNDHGRIVTIGLEKMPGGLVEELSWLAPTPAGEDELLRESRRWSWEDIDGGWSLDLTFELAPGSGADPDGVLLGSPGSNGRAGGGYGGFFWRMAPCTDIDVRADAVTGTDSVHGAIAPSLSWSARFGGKPVRLDFHSDDGDPWFVRTGEYPGVGLALAWEDSAAVSAVSAESPLRRKMRVEIRDT
ncbi:hypothetical protein GCM10027344_22060 [Spelaeicoccus albus]